MSLPSSFSSRWCIGSACDWAVELRSGPASRRRSGLSPWSSPAILWKTASVGSCGRVRLSVPLTTAAILIAVVVSFQSVIFTYDGWYSAIYFSEEDTDPARNLPRSMIGSVLIVITLYLLVNFAFLHVLSFSQLAASQLPAADAAQVMFGARGGGIITALSFLSLVTITNATFMQTPRILYGMGRDGLIVRAAAVVNRRGTPTVALMMSSVVEILLVLSGTFGVPLAYDRRSFLSSCMARLCLCFGVAPKPQAGCRGLFSDWGYPWTVAIVLVLSLVFLAGVVIGDPTDGVYALIASRQTTRSIAS